VYAVLRCVYVVLRHMYVYVYVCTTEVYESEVSASLKTVEWAL